MAISFFSAEVEFLLPHPRKTSSWINLAVKREKKRLKTLTYIFCSDPYLLHLNKQFLNHSTFTDVITFDYSAQPGVIEGEIYISIDRVAENARKFKVPFDNELHRVIVHGALHLIGYNDKGTKEKALMRKKEEAYLSLRK